MGVVVLMTEIVVGSSVRASKWRNIVILQADVACRTCGFCTGCE